jgi:hypothetical protein
MTARYELRTTRLLGGRDGFYAHCSSCGSDVQPTWDKGWTTPGMVSAAMGDHDCWSFWHQLFAEFQEVGA